MTKVTGYYSFLTEQTYSTQEEKDNAEVIVLKAKAEKLAKEKLQRGLESLLTIDFNEPLRTHSGKRNYKRNI